MHEILFFPYSTSLSDGSNVIKFQRAVRMKRNYTENSMQVVDFTTLMKVRHYVSSSLRKSKLMQVDIFRLATMQS